MPTFPKPEPRKRTQARKARAEAAVVKAVRAACVLRDGLCRLSDEPWSVTAVCRGPSQWTHLPPFTRARTRGLPPERRHSTAWTIMACQRHHDMIDGRRTPTLKVFCLTDKGANGPIQVSVE